MHNLFMGLVQEHFNILGIQLNNTKSRTIPTIIINIPEELINKLNEHECKSVNHLINMLEAPIKKELKSQAGYDVYFKWLSALHKAALELLCTSVGAPLKLNSNHVNKSKFNKPNFIHAILVWVSINTFSILYANQICVVTNPNQNSPKFYQWGHSHCSGDGQVLVWHRKHDHSFLAHVSSDELWWAEPWQAQCRSMAYAWYNLPSCFACLVMGPVGGWR